MYTISRHILRDHLSGDDRRFSLQPETLSQIVRLVAPQLDKFDRRSIHQVAVVIGRPKSPITVGNTRGDRIVIAVDIRTQVVCSIFARWAWQGKPRACQVMIDLEGNVVN